MALAARSLDTAVRLHLLDLRAESYIALGDLKRASDDAAAMLNLAKTGKTAAATAQALNRRALVQMRQGELRAATATATSALKSRPPEQAEAAHRAEPVARSPKHSFAELANEDPRATRPRRPALFKALGDASGHGRALWGVAIGIGRLGGPPRAIGLPE